MIIGIGCDIAHISRFKELYKKQGDAFLKRCFDPLEVEYITASKSEAITVSRIAKRWAAKEAAAKALGTGIRDSIILKDIVVSNDALGAPKLSFKGAAADEAKRLGATNIQLSLSDDGDYAQAFVVLSTRTD